MGFIKNYHYRQDIKAIKDSINLNKDDLPFIVRKMDILYSFLKEIAPQYANQKRYIKDDYRDFIYLLDKIEKIIPTHFILKNEPDFSSSFAYPKINSSNISNYREEEIIKYIVYRVRTFMASGLSSDNLGKLDLLNYCSEASGKTCFVCNALGIYSKECLIAPAFYREKNLYEVGNNHLFVMVTIRDKQFVVDLTYSQFFHIRDNNLNRLGIPLLGGCAPGTYMALTEERRAFAEKLMRDGYFEATSEYLKLYFDGFAMSYRNGLYYEDRGVLDYTTDYEAQDYLNFIAGRDNQINHENREFLGRQKKILKNPDMSFIPKTSDKIS